MGIPKRLAVSDRPHGYETEVAAETADGRVVLLPGSNPFTAVDDKRATAAEVVRRWNGFPDLVSATDDALAFVQHTLEFFDWSQFPSLRESVERLRGKLVSVMAANG